MNELNVIQFRLDRPFVITLLCDRIIKSMEGGIQRRLYNRLYTKKPVCVNAFNFQSIGIRESQSAVIVLVSGMAVAMLVLTFERILHSKSFGKRFCLKF
jgi:hypothetical protein